MLKREWGAENNGKLPDLFIPSKTATLVLKFAVEDPSLGKTAALVPEFALKDLPLGRTLWWWWWWWWCPPLWAGRQHARLSRSGPGFYPRSGQVSWVRFFRGFSSPVRQMSGSFRPPRSPNIIWPSLLSSIIIRYGRQWPEMLTRPKDTNIHIYRVIKCRIFWEVVVPTKTSKEVQ